MSSSPEIDERVRAAIIQRPDAILDDHDLMHALIAANDRTMGDNIIDLRGIAMERLEHRLGRLEDTHRSVIAAAYDNLAGTNQIHRAVLCMLDPVSLDAFLQALTDDVTQILRLDAIRLVLESGQDPISEDGAILTMPSGFVDAYIGRPYAQQQTTLRPVEHGSEDIYGGQADRIRSEACLRLHLQDGRPGMLVMGSTDITMFCPQHGTDLLNFFGGVLERTIRRWLP